jgi:hypothetical protein
VVNLAAEINKQYPTLLSPNAILLGLYWVVVYALQIGFCLILVTARKDETKVRSSSASDVGYWSRGSGGAEHDSFLFSFLSFRLRAFTTTLSSPLSRLLFFGYVTLGATRTPWSTA